MAENEIATTLLTFGALIAALVFWSLFFAMVRSIARKRFPAQESITNRVHPWRDPNPPQVGDPIPERPA